MLPPLRHVNLHPDLHPRLHARVVHGRRAWRGGRREDGGQHHAEAAELGDALVDVAVVAEEAVGLDGVGDAGVGVYVGEFAAGMALGRAGKGKRERGEGGWSVKVGGGERG